MSALPARHRFLLEIHTPDKGLMQLGWTPHTGSRRVHRTAYKDQWLKQGEELALGVLGQSRLESCGIGVARRLGDRSIPLDLVHTLIAQTHVGQVVLRLGREVVAEQASPV